MASAGKQPRPNRRAIVVGGSIAGLFTAAFLRRIGWQAEVYERSSIELIGRGVGIFATHLELFEALDSCGAGTVDIGVIVYKRITFDRKGNVIAEKPLLQIVTSWDRLRQVLLKAIDRSRYHFGYAFDRVEQDGNGVHVYFANGRSERADLLVACDGFRSSVRAQLLPNVQPIYSGYYIWRGAPNESDLSPETRMTMFPYYSFFLGDQVQALGYPIAGADDELRIGHRRYNWGWYRLATAQELRAMCVDDQGCEYEFGVPPPLVRKDLIAQMPRRGGNIPAAVSRLSAPHRPAVLHTGLRLLLTKLGIRARCTGRRCSLDASSSHGLWCLQGWCRGTSFS